jgi:hypothetical protein
MLCPSVPTLSHELATRQQALAQEIARLARRLQSTAVTLAHDPRRDLAIEQMEEDLRLIRRLQDRLLEDQLIAGWLPGAVSQEDHA